MTQRNLDRAFRPRSVAVVGGSSRDGSVGRVVIENILRDGFNGPLYAVNPKYNEVLGVPCFARIADLPSMPDLAVIVTPPTRVPGVIAELGAAGCKAAVVITAGITAESGLRQAMLDAARPHLLRIIGPNTIGILAPPLGLNASFATALPRPGRLGLISQSGAMVSALVDWAAEEGLGFSQIVSLGDMADVDVADCLDYFAMDGGTSAVLMYLESIPAARKFMSAARAAARLKPIVALKPGRHAEAQKAAQTHTGALAGADRVVDAALRRAGVIRVHDLEDLFVAAEVTGRYRPLSRARVGVVTNGGGAGVLAVDHLLDAGCELAVLDPKTKADLDAVLPPTWSHDNPVDIIGDAPPGRYASSVAAVAKSGGVDAVLVMNCPTALASPVEAAKSVAALTSNGLIEGKPLLACWLGKRDAGPARALLEASGIANLDTPIEAARAVALLTQWSRVQDALQRVPSAHPGVPVDRAGAAVLLKAAAVDGRTILTEPEAKSFLAAYGIGVPETLVAHHEDDVVRHTETLLDRHPSVVVKLLSRTVTHKSDVGGVALDLRTVDEARTAASTIRERVIAKGLSLDGFTVQPMVKAKGAHELIAGIATDPIFGPTIVFGTGGTAVEVVDDTATGLVPLDDVLAGDLIDQTRVGRLLAGYRDRPPANRDAIIAALTGLSQISIDHPAVVGIDINPLLATADGVIALDARVEIDPSKLSVAGPNPDLAVRPYPFEAVQEADLGGLALVIRPIRPEDADLYPAFLARTNPEDIRLRFLTPLTSIPRDMLIRLTQLDYDREMALVAIERQSGQLCAIARYAADPDREKAEFAILVRSDLKGRGLGTLLMTTLVEYARGEGIGHLHGSVLRENRRMLEFCEQLGFGIESGDDASTMRATMELRGGPGARVSSLTCITGEAARS